MLGKRLFDRRVGLLAAVFAAFTVLHIQLSHFYTVDTLLTFFIVLAMLCAVQVMRRGSLGASAWMGVCLGLALATKVSVAVGLDRGGSVAVVGCPRRAGAPVTRDTPGGAPGWHRACRRACPGRLRGGRTVCRD